MKPRKLYGKRDRRIAHAQMNRTNRMNLKTPKRGQSKI